ncbi:MAG: caspase family protein [Deltaproteobacteria bacterium]|nr:caspase family protein [Deltaproteobacteria bacterium]
MRRHPHTPLLAACLLLFACASAQTEKGDMVALKVKPEALDAAHAGKRLALVVGIDTFDDAGWRGLRFASKDATDLARVLADPARGGFDVAVRTTPEESRREALLGSIRELATRNTSPDDVVLVYFSTHGTLARDASGSLKRYVVASDTRIGDVKSTGLEMDDVERELEKLPSRRKVLVLAMCHSGAGKSLLPPDVEKELEGTKADFFPRPLEEQSRASIVLAACDWGETAREDEALGNDIYTHFLVEALERPADRNGDGAVTATEAHDYARRRTYAFTHGEQKPSARILEVGADPVVLEGKIDRLGQPELFGYEASLDGLSLRVDGDEAMALPGGQSLAAGSHRVQILKGDGAPVLDTNMNLGLGERVDVGDLLARHGNSPFLLGAAVGYQGFLDADASRTVAGPTPALQLSLAWDGAIARRVGLRFDGAVAAGTRTLQTAAMEQAGQSVPFHYLGLQLGTSATYGARIGPVHLDAGPRIGAVYLQRRFDLATFQTTQSYFVVSPGLTGGLSLPVSERLELFVRADVSAEVIAVDAQSRILGQGALWAGLGWRP